MHNHAHTHFNEITKQTVRRLALSLIITLIFVFVEIGAGVFANSLALLTDAAHNFTDVLALALSWWALRLTSQPANQEKTYGYHRAGILAALANSTTLVVIALGISMRLISVLSIRRGAGRCVDRRRGSRCRH